MKPSPRLVLLLVVLAAGPALAQTPPIKTGLWEVRDTGEKGDAKEQKRAEQMKNLPPQVRAQMDKMLKERGMSVGSDGQTRVCLARSSLDSGAWAQREGCETTFVDRSGKRWKWHTTCPDTEIDGEASFASDESYTVQVRTSGKRGTHERTLAARWVGSDCGGMKPLSPQMRPAR